MTHEHLIFGMCSGAQALFKIGPPVYRAPYDGYCKVNSLSWHIIPGSSTPTATTRARLPMRTRTLILCSLAGLVTWSSSDARGQSKNSDSAGSIRERRVDASGDEVPTEASARLGTLRLRCNDGFRSVAYTPAGRYVVTGGWGGARVWDAATGQLIRQM